MRLLNCETMKLEDHLVHDSCSMPRHAILSHTWEVEEISISDVQQEPQHWQHKKGALKVLMCISLARKLSFSYIWIDTCCIDKSSSAELSEAINSMFEWYLQSAVCIAYLADVDSMDSFAQNKWFTRGWTLQELVAPRKVQFYRSDWAYLGDQDSLISEIVKVTSIDRDLLLLSSSSSSLLWEDEKKYTLYSYSISERMSWASRRQITRPEDNAYCLLGLFDMNMPLIYGEGGEKTFFRLQEAILKKTDDHSILCYDPNHAYSSLALASSPSLFNLPHRILSIRIAPSLRDLKRQNFYLDIGKRDELHIGILLGDIVRHYVHPPESDSPMGQPYFDMDLVDKDGGKLVMGILNCEIHKNDGYPTRPVIIFRKYRDTFTFARNNSGTMRLPLYELRAIDPNIATAEPVSDHLTRFNWVDSG